jgi:tRNA (guanine-N7-)-methyltransferase
MNKRGLQDYPEISLAPEQIDSWVDFGEIFNRPGPVHIVIGCGKGTFLLNQARHEPESNFLGIEWANKFYKHAVDRMGRWDMDNVRIIRTDAAELVSEYIPDSSVSFYHVYFPDPWPKKRHHKRRFINSANMSQMLRTLVAGGFIQIATDHADYYEQIKDVLREYREPGVIETVPFTPGSDARDDEIVGTNYERKYIKEKRNIHAVAVRKK